mgnify:CR=1 FL=1
MKQKTVVITGASSGIGMEFARAFSKMGCRLILTARRKERLEKLSLELRARLLLRIYQERANAISFLKI